MAKTNAERQARYRLRQKLQGHLEGTPMERLDAWVPSDAAHGLPGPGLAAWLHRTGGAGPVDPCRRQRSEEGGLCRLVGCFHGHPVLRYLVTDSSGRGDNRRACIRD